MSYFSNLPYTTYELGGKTFTIKDIFRQAAFISEYKPLSDLYESYTILDGETPHTISEKFYSTGSYFWVILVFNNIQSMFKDWPLSENVLQLTCEEKYGEYLHHVRHYERNGNVIGEFKEFSSPWVIPDNPGPLDPTVYPVSFYEYESKLNDAKREILILRPQLIGEFVTQFKEAINE